MPGGILSRRADSFGPFCIGVAAWQDSAQNKMKIRVGIEILLAGIFLLLRKRNHVTYTTRQFKNSYMFRRAGTLVCTPIAAL